MGPVTQGDIPGHCVPHSVALGECCSVREAGFVSMAVEGTMFVLWRVIHEPSQPQGRRGVPFK